MLELFLFHTGDNQKKECIAFQGINFVFDGNCAEQRRHVCMMEPKSDGGTCGAPFDDLGKCVKYFPAAGLLDKVHADAFCMFNGGTPPKVPKLYKQDPAFDRGNFLFMMFKCISSM